MAQEQMGITGSVEQKRYSNDYIQCGEAYKYPYDLSASETWLMSNTITRRPNVYINRCLLIICWLYCPTYINNRDLWNITFKELIMTQIKRKIWRWINHTNRKPPDNITKVALEWNTQSSTNLGRSRKR